MGRKLRNEHLLWGANCVSMDLDWLVGGAQVGRKWGVNGEGSGARRKKIHRCFQIVRNAMDRGPNLRLIQALLGL